MPKFDINLKSYKFRPHDDIKRGELQILCNGKDCNDQFLNAIGRIAEDRLPTYAFVKPLIKIEKINPETGYHDSIPFNHDMMRDRLQFTPLIGVDPGISFLHERYWKNVDYLSEDRPVHENEKRIEAYIDVKNTADETDIYSIKHVTTNDMKLYIDNEIVNIYSKEYPFLLISLKPKEAFKCSMRAVLGIGSNHACLKACSNFCYDQETEKDSTILKFQAASQIDEYTLVARSLEYFKIRTQLLKDEVNRLYLLEEKPDKRFKIIIKDEDHTMGEVINYELQSHDDILKSSCNKDDYLIQEIRIDVEAFKKEKLLNAILESFDNLLKKIEIFTDKFNKIIPDKYKKKKMKKQNDSTSSIKKN